MITFRELDEDDFGILAGWLGSEHVQAWWRDPSAASTVEEKYGPCVRGEAPTEVFVVRFESADIGIIQRYRIADHPDWLQTLARTGFDAGRSAGIDYLLGEEAVVGKGVGTEMITGFTAKLFRELDDIASIAVTPQAANAASCRALEKSGYERRWLGMLDSDDLSDADEAALYVCARRAWFGRTHGGPTSG